MSARLIVSTVLRPHSVYSVALFVPVMDQEVCYAYLLCAYLLCTCCTCVTILSVTRIFVVRQLGSDVKYNAVVLPHSLSCYFNATVFDFCDSTSAPKIPHIYTKTGDKGWSRPNFYYCLVVVDEIACSTFIAFQIFNSKQATCLEASFSFAWCQYLLLILLVCCNHINILFCWLNVLHCRHICYIYWRTKS